MLRYVLVAFASLAPLMAASPASATQFAGSYVVSANQTDPGLVVGITGVSPLSFDLDSGSSTSIALFDIATPESDVGTDDRAAKPISVNFSFLSPSLATSNVDGTTVGQRSLFGVVQNGSVRWDNTASFDFGSKGVLTVALNNATFGGGLFGLSSTPATVYGTFALSGGTAGAVPETATWAMMLVGFGAAGAVMRRRKVDVSFG